ncbi:hypothetical protein Vretimale_16340 [Volvox reticuliferus]|uniref:Uncharacterized protein n=1 Tax=Volvox reticuliferus TaxID=1737510 RepID=A0A8J4GTR6_9CHLO|nr:hypothetical protein Vretifemale_17858 [Volvox reticuliferus]GIM13139.1 hypothetical protein Vretimale_16340 [Volvox reticuliferus]
MAMTTSVNTGQLVQWLLEYGQRVRDIQERAWVYSHASYAKKGLPLLYEAMRGPSQLLSGTGGDAKAQKEFLRNVAERAQAYVAELQPLVSSLKIISQNFASIAQLLAELHRVLGSLTLRSYPDLLHQYMDTFCGAVKAGLLLEEVPRKAAAQMVQLACSYIDKDVATQLRAAASDPIFSEPSMVTYMQKMFRATMPRIAQILELVVGPAMIVADNCQGVAAAGLLEMIQQPQQHQISIDASSSGIDASTNGDMEASPAMGMFGMTRQQVYPFLRHREAIRQWGILGFLIFPEILNQQNSAQRLSMLLSDGFALHLYKDRLIPVHQLMLQHLGSMAYSVLGVSSVISTGNMSPRSAGGLGGLLGKGIAMIGGVGRLRKSLTEEDANELKQPHPIFVEAAGAAAVAAPLQHRMWRAYVTGQLRSIHAACSACPARIPGQMDMLLAALSLGREELLWFCRRSEVDIPAEVLPILNSRGVITSSHSCMPTADDGLQALQLLSAMDAIHRLLVENHTALCKQIKDANGAELQAHVVGNTPRVEFRLRQAVAQVTSGSPAAAAAAAAAAAGATGLQPFKDLTDLLRSVLMSSTPPADAPARVSSACGIWMYVSLQLASADPPLKAAKVLQYAENTKYLDVLQKSLDAARLLHEGPLLHASAADLAPGLQGARVEPLRRAAKAALSSGKVEHTQAALGAMQGLHWLLPARAEAYAAATSASAGSLANTTASALLANTSVGSTAAASNRNAAGEVPTTPGAASAAAATSGSRCSGSRPQPGSQDDLPASCMKDVMECLRLMLSPVVMAPLRNVAACNSAARSSNPMHIRPGGPSAARGMSRPKDKEGSNGGGSVGRSATPERLRPETVPTTATVAEGPLSRNLQQLALGDTNLPRKDMDPYHVMSHELGADLAALPSASELAVRLVPLVLALDNGRMLLADGRGGDALAFCRAQLLEAIRDNFSQLIVNTATAITQVAVPVPSIQLGPLRLFVEVMSILQPHLSTELLPELARLLLQQTAAPTLQTIGLEAVMGPIRPANNNPAPPSTSAEAAAPTTPHLDTITFSLAPRAGSLGSGGALSAGAVGPMTRSLNNTNLARTSASEADRNIGPMTKGLSNSGGGSTAPAPVASVSVVRVFHEWLWRTVIMLQDDRHPVVWYDAEVGAFVSAESAVSGKATLPSLASATSVRELSLIFELFGPCAAADLTRGCDQLIHACLEEMQAFLDANQGPLQELLDAAHLALDKRFTAICRVLPTLTPPASGPTASRGPHCLRDLADTVQRLGRCLALRMQLGRAAVTAADQVADFVTLALREMAAPVTVACDSSKTSDAEGTATPVAAMPLERREWAALLRLSSGSSSGEVECSYGGCLLPERDDPLLTAHLASLLHGLPAAQRWHRLPALMAALMAAPQWNVAFPSVGPHMAHRSSKGTSTPRGTSTQAMLPPTPVSPAAFTPLGAFNTVTVAMCLSLQAAMSQVLHPAGSQFLLGCGTPVAAMLCAYQRTALAVVQVAVAGAECSPAATAAKQHMLASLEQIPILRRYNYIAPYTSEEAVAVDAALENDGAQHTDNLPTPLTPPSGSLELGQSWWASGGNMGLSLAGLPQPLGKGMGSLIQIEVCEPSLADGRWSGEVDGWRPPSRLLPLVMGHVA